MAEDTNTLNYQISRVVGGHNEALKEVIRQFGVSVPASTKAEELTDKAAALGSKYSFNNFLSTGTAGVFGLPSTATPEDAFKWLSKYNEHWWSVLHGSAGKGYNEARTELNVGSTYGKHVPIGYNTQTYQYSTSVTVNQSTGAVTLTNPKTVTLNAVGYSYSTRDADTNKLIAELQKITSMAPVYVKGLFAGSLDNWTSYTDTTITYIPAGITISKTNRYNTFFVERMSSDDDDYWDVRAHYYDSSTSYVKLQTVTSQIYSIPAGETTYVHSTNRSAYPDSGTQSGLTYRYLGKPFENFVRAPRMHVGSYIGTGLAGAGNPNMLSFDFTPELLIVSRSRPSMNLANLDDSGVLIAQNGVTEYSSSKSASSTNNSVLHITWSDKSVSFYHADSYASGQLNSLNETYHYLAIG